MEKEVHRQKSVMPRATWRGGANTPTGLTLGSVFPRDQQGMVTRPDSGEPALSALESMVLLCAMISDGYRTVGAQGGPAGHGLGSLSTLSSMMVATSGRPLTTLARSGREKRDSSDEWFPASCFPESGSTELGFIFKPRFLFSLFIILGGNL